MFNKIWFTPLLVAALAACGSDNDGSSSSSSSSSSSGNPVDSSNGLVISEIVASSAIDTFIDGNDWIELKNTSTQAINLSQYSLSDSESDAFPLPNITVNAGEFIHIAAADADSPPSGGEIYVPFKLGKQDSVTLHKNNQVIDSLSWMDGDAKKGRSFGMLDNVAQTLYPTPSYANVPYILFSKNQIFRVNVDMTPENWATLLENAQDEQWYPADFELNGAKLSNVAIKTKGQSSLSMLANVPEGHPTEHRYGFKIDFNRYEDQKFMGMKKLVLGSGFADPTMMRDVIAYQLFTDVGMPSPEASFVDLWVAGEHLGVYSLIEAIDSEFIEKHFEDDKDADLKGDLYKGEVSNKLTWEGSDISNYGQLRLKTNEETLGTAEEGEALLRFLDTLNNSSDPLKHVDKDLMLRYFAALVLTGNTDSYLGFSANNFYLYEHRSTDTFTFIPWDFNLGLGTVGSSLESPGVTIGDGFVLGSDPDIGGGFNFGGGGGGGGLDIDFGSFDFGAIVSCDTVEHLIDTPKATSADRPLIEHLLADPELLSQYRAHIRTLIDGPWRKDNIRAEIMRWADLLDPYVKADTTKYFTYTEWRHNLTNDMPSNSNNQIGRGGAFFGPATGLIRFIEDRVDNVRRQLDGEIPSSNSAGTACL